MKINIATDYVVDVNQTVTPKDYPSKSPSHNYINFIENRFTNFAEIIPNIVYAKIASAVGNWQLIVIGRQLSSFAIG